MIVIKLSVRIDRDVLRNAKLSVVVFNKSYDVIKSMLLLVLNFQ